VQKATHINQLSSVLPAIHTAMLVTNIPRSRVRFSVSNDLAERNVLGPLFRGEHRLPIVP
jgi:hypothetical protein